MSSETSTGSKCSKHVFVAMKEERFDDICWPALPYNRTAQLNQINKMHTGLMTLTWLFPSCIATCFNLHQASKSYPSLVHFLFVLLTTT